VPIFFFFSHNSKNYQGKTFTLCLLGLHQLTKNEGKAFYFIFVAIDAKCNTGMKHCALRGHQ
jgi:hypothetical protein